MTCGSKNGVTPIDVPMAIDPIKRLSVNVIETPHA